MTGNLHIDGSFPTYAVDDDGAADVGNFSSLSNAVLQWTLRRTAGASYPEIFTIDGAVALSLGSKILANLASGTNPTDAVNKSQLDAVSTGGTVMTVASYSAGELEVNINILEAAYTAKRMDITFHCFWSISTNNSLSAVVRLVKATGTSATQVALSFLWGNTSTESDASGNAAAFTQGFGAGFTDVADPAAQNTVSVRIHDTTKIVIKATSSGAAATFGQGGITGWLT
jgi:hypothetical protein